MKKRRSFKKTMSLILTILFVLTIAAPVTAANPPTVVGITTFFNDYDINGVMVIEFNEQMDTTVHGTVYLSSVTGYVYLSSVTQEVYFDTLGSWSADNYSFVMPYAGLSYATDYTIFIADFQNQAGEMMIPDDGWIYTTDNSPSSGGGGGGSSGTTLSPSKATASLDSAGVYNDITFTVNRTSGTITALKNGATVLVKDQDYTLNENKITIKGTYLATLPEGATKLTVDMSSGTDPVFTVTIPAKTEVPDVVDDNPDLTAPDLSSEQIVVILTVGSLSYTVNNEIKACDAPPVIVGSRTFVPLRIISESLGANVQWDDATKSVTITDNGNIVVMTVGSGSYTVNGETRALDTAGYIDGSRTMVPIRFVGEGLGAVVDWENETKKVIITR